MTTKSEYLEAMLKNVERSTYKLNKQSTVLQSDVNNDYIAASEFIRRVNNMSEVEHSKQLQEAMKILADQWTLERNELIELQSQIHHNVAEDVPKFEKILKEHKKSINERVKARKKTINEQQRAAELKMRENGKNVDQGTVAGRQALDLTEESMNAMLTEFEYVRIRYIKDKFERLLKAQTAYHAKSMEMLTSAIQAFAAVDPATEANAFWNELEQYDQKSGIATAHHRAPNFARIHNSTPLVASLHIGTAELSATQQSGQMDPQTQIQHMQNNTQTQPGQQMQMQMQTGQQMQMQPGQQMQMQPGQQMHMQSGQQMLMQPGQNIQLHPGQNMQIQSGQDMQNHPQSMSNQMQNQNPQFQNTSYQQMQTPSPQSTHQQQYTQQPQQNIQTNQLNMSMMSPTNQTQQYNNNPSPQSQQFSPSYNMQSPNSQTVSFNSPFNNSSQFASTVPMQQQSQPIQNQYNQGDRQQQQQQQLQQSQQQPQQPQQSQQQQMQQQGNQGQGRVMYQNGQAIMY